MLQANNISGSEKFLPEKPELPSVVVNLQDISKPNDDLGEKIFLTTHINRDSFIPSPVVRLNTAFTTYSMGGMSYISHRFPDMSLEDLSAFIKALQTFEQNAKDFFTEEE